MTLNSTKLSDGVLNLPTQLTQSIGSTFTTDVLNTRISTDGFGDSCYYNGTTLVKAKPNNSGSSSFSVIDVEILQNEYKLNLQLE